MTTINGDLHIAGALFAGNIAQGSVRVNPEPDTPTSISITGLNVRGSGAMSVQATAATTVPGLRVKSVTATIVSDSEIAIWVYRTNNISTVVHWFIRR